ncbi:MAG: hypothetical protein GWM89_01600 [Candidatus Dadabacteria bacterium]|nr:hypothetical protein [Candidatus Dadabacteria bacterium]NIY21128.1 hypothetical protein [Candidatus Dadabacteria bacterium]
MPLNYIKSTTSLGLTQFIYSIIGMFAVFGLARTLKISAKISYFCSHLFFLTPLVLLQSGSGYIGIIISVFIFLSLYQLVRLYESQNRVHLFLFGMSAGLMIGMKYTLFLNLFMFFILLAPLLLKRSRLEISVLLLIILSCCCYWYIRNLAYFGDPVYPLLSPEAIHLKLPKTAGFYTQLADLYTKIKLLFTTDDGIGSLHGGYGLYFWSAAVPAWIYLFIRCLKTNIQNRTTEIIIWSQLLIGIAIIILIPVDRIKFQARYFLFVIGIGSLAIGSIISHFRYKTYQIGIIILCCVSALFSLTQLAISQLPSYSIDIPIKDKINKADYAKLRYIRLSSSMNSMGFLWETLDFTTRHHEKGLNVYFAMSYYPFAASFYGSKLQNRVWNFDRNNENMPDAFLFFESAPSRIKYIKRKFTSAQLMSNHDYELVDRSGYSYFFLNKKFLADDSAIYNSLLEHYKRYFINEIESAKLLVPYLDKDTPVITSHYIGFGLRYLKYTNIINNEIYTLPVGKEKEFINILDSKNFYTINKFIENHEASVKHKFNFNKESIALILNQ